MWLRRSRGRLQRKRHLDGGGQLFKRLRGVQGGGKIKRLRASDPCTAETKPLVPS